MAVPYTRMLFSPCPTFRWPAMSTCCSCLVVPYGCMLWPYVMAVPYTRTLFSPCPPCRWPAMSTCCSCLISSSSSPTSPCSVTCPPSQIPTLRPTSSLTWSTSRYVVDYTSQTVVSTSKTFTGLAPNLTIVHVKCLYFGASQTPASLRVPTQTGKP